MDFSQELVTTLHRISVNQEGTIRRVEELSQARPCALVIPMLYSELEEPALSSIVEALNRAKYLNSVVIALTAEDREQYRKAVKFFAKLSIPHIVVWLESPSVKEVFASLGDAGINLAKYSGKGIALWTAFGLASIGNYAIAVHDADIESYDESLAANLLFPLVDPELDYFFSKGYYARLSGERFYGRVCRLFVWPMLDSLQAREAKPNPFFRYLRAFNYPLAGEFAITSDLAQNIRVPTDWGLEIGILAEVYRNASLKRICQVDLGVYSHKHKAVGAGKNEGLLKMSHDIMTTLYRVIVENDGRTFSKDDVLSLSVLYRRTAQDYIRKYFSDSKFNRLLYERHVEESLVESLSEMVKAAGESYAADPVSEQIPDWLRAVSAKPELREKLVQTTPGKTKLKQRLLDAVLADSAEVK